jgi:hypothetical protein
MDIEKKEKKKLTDEEIKANRKKYMRDYYKKKVQKMRDNPRQNKTPKVQKVPPLQIIRKEVVVSFQ